ncbi:MAG TPA: hypothetical protein VHC39_17190 [Rhizomicrobium sp.]|nr:hypothetical protein [Rhizomicrobium sp.]
MMIDPGKRRVFLADQELGVSAVSLPRTGMQKIHAAAQKICHTLFKGLPASVRDGRQEGSAEGGLLL